MGGNLKITKLGTSVGCFLKAADSTFVDISHCSSVLCLENINNWLPRNAVNCLSIADVRVMKMQIIMKLISRQLKA